MDQSATFIADHFLSLFAGLAVLVLGLAALLWSLVRRLREPLWRRVASGLQRVGEDPRSRNFLEHVPGARFAQSSALFAGSYLLLDLVAGFLFALAALSVFFVVADESGLDEELARFDDQLATQLGRTLSPEILHAFAWVTRLANAEVQVCIGVTVTLFLLLRKRPWLAASWVAAVGGNGLLNRSLKALFQRDRPLHEHGLVIESGWSFPSGHASGSVAIYGMLAYLLVRSTRPVWHLPIVLSAIGLVLLVGFSRVILQVHFFSDVIAGFASATAWLVVCIAAAETIRVRRSQISRPD